MTDELTDPSAPDKGDADGDLLEQLKGWFRVDVEKANTWRKEAEEDFRFRDGDQWNEAEKQALQDQERPVLVFNRTGVLVDAVVGSEIGNRREVRYIPREMNDAKPNELLSSAADWFREQCEAEFEESEAFKDTVTAGMGWTETRLDFSENPDGDPKIERFDPMEAVWDANAVKANLVDRKRSWRVRQMPIAEARKLAPGVDDSDLHAAWASETDKDGEPHRADPANRYGGESQDAPTDRKMVTIVACQYFREEVFYRAAIINPETGEPMRVDLDKDKHAIAQKAGAVLKSVRMTKQVVVQCILGRTIIKKPRPTQTGSFTWNCITGLPDQDKGTFYGIVRRAKDPQRWANKWLSQMMHILNSQAKGGIMAEEDAFEDQRAAEDSWARTERITWVTAGGIAKVKEKPVAQFPAGFDRLLQYADEAIIKATGINMELLGMRDATQAGVLEYQRKQQGIALLATFFDSARRYRKIQGRGMLFLIQNFLSDGRLVRIVGEDEAQYVPLMKGDTASAEYDVIVDDAPTSTNEKEKTWQLLGSLLPMFGDAIGPKEMLLLAKYSPLPSSLVEALGKSIMEQQEGGQDPTQNPAFMLEQLKLANDDKALQVQLLEQQNKSKELDYKMASLQQDGAISVMRNQTEQQNTQVDGINATAALLEAQKPTVLGSLAN